MRKFRLLFFCFVAAFLTKESFECHAQTTKKYSFSFKNVRLIDALDSIDKKLPYSIYFKEEWIDSVRVSGMYSNFEINTILDSLLNSAGINYTILNNSIILTGDVKLTKSLIYDSTSVSYQSKYIFEREFKGNTDQEVITVGKRSLMKAGATALVAGFVKNAETGDPISSAEVYTKDATINTLTDERGFFSLNLPVGYQTITVHYSGMKVKQQKIILFSDGNMNVILEEEPHVLNEITIYSDKNANVSNVSMGATSINMEESKNIPKILGENDLLQVALTLPGIQNVGEGSAGINVRGGKTDQNIILLNNATIYNPFHFLGFFSSFNADVIGSSELLKSGIPVSYGGRLSSLLNVKMKKANKDHFAAKLGINPITTSASVEVPIIKGKTSLLAGVRTTYSDWILRRVPNENLKNSKPTFSDYSVNLNHSYGESNSINVSGYYSQDRFSLTPDSTTRYINKNISFEWSHLISEKLISTLIAGLDSYQFTIVYASELEPETTFTYGFDINEKFGKLAFDYFPSDKHDIQLGADAKLYNLQPGKLEPTGASAAEPIELQPEKGLESSFFISDEFKLSKKISLLGGLRYSFFSPIGYRSINYYQPGVPKNESSLISTKEFDKGELIDTYGGPEVRFSGKYSINEVSSVKLSITQMRQYIHAISNTISVSPTDTWKLSDPNIAPQQSMQFSVGYYRDFLDKKVDVSIETYYKKLTNLLDYKIGADLVLNKNLETDVIQGIGRAYGIELLVRKPGGKLNGWLSYTYSRSQQKFDSEFNENRINNGNYFPSNFEKPHDLSIVANYKATRRYSFSMNVVYSTGRPVTYPTGKYLLSNIEITHFSDRNSYRIPDYFRIDLSLNIESTHKIKTIGKGYWSFSVYNVLARRNVYSVFFTNSKGTIKGYELSVLGSAIPSITYNVKF